MITFIADGKQINWILNFWSRLFFCLPKLLNTKKFVKTGPTLCDVNNFYDTLLTPIRFCVYEPGLETQPALSYDKVNVLKKHDGT